MQTKLEVLEITKQNILREKKRSAIIVDIDNTFCESEFIFDEIKELDLHGQEKWNYFHSNIHRCKVNLWCVMLVNNYLAMDYDVIFLTARSEAIRQQTIDFIRTYLHKSFDAERVSLYMRSKNDLSPAWNVKEKWLKKIKQNYHISFAIDDDYDNCQMFFNNDIPALYPMANIFLKRSLSKTQYSKFQL